VVAGHWSLVTSLSSSLVTDYDQDPAK
jgi:hypothetical protein